MRKPEKKLLYIWIAAGFIPSLIFAGVTALGLLAVQSVSAIAGFILMFTVVQSVITIYSTLLYKSWSFELRDDYLYLEHGVIRKIRSMVPYVRVQHIDTQRGAIERLAGLSSVIVYTAGSRGADVNIPGLKPEDAEQIQEKLRDVAIESEDRDAV